jgi:hypothetical protein
MLHRLVSKLQWLIERSGHGLPRQIVGRGPQPPGDDDDIGSSGCDPESLDVVGKFITDGGVMANTDPEIAKSSADELAVRIESLTASEFIANGNDFRFDVCFGYKID